MIGLVLVSHVAEIADGAARLARQMGGDVPIAAAGGIEEDDGFEVGTDAMRVLAAIEEVWSADGVLVLMDLGSALLSADLALDLLDDERRAAVRLTDAPLVEGAVAAAAIIQAGGDLATVMAEASGALRPKRSQLGTDESDGHAAPSSDDIPDPDTAVSAVFTIGMPAGLHARPVALFVGTVGRLDAKGWVTDRTTGKGPVSASSFTALATLGVLHGHEIEVTASGPEAGALLDAIAGLVEDDFGEGEAPSQDAPIFEVPAVGTAGGIGVSPGVAVGPATHLVRVDDEPDDRVEPEASDPEVERRRLDEAVERVRNDLVGLQRLTEERAGEGEAAIFIAHLAMLDDAELWKGIDRRIAAGDLAGIAWRTEMSELAASFEQLPDEYQAERAADVRAVANRVDDALAGRSSRMAPSGPGVLLTEDLDPGQTALLDPETVWGIVTSRGGPTSHTAILARGLGIPAVVGAPAVVSETTPGTTVVIDGDTGSVSVDPDEESMASARRAVEERRVRVEAARVEATRPAVTRDGRIIDVEANLGAVDEATPAVEAGADGVGLLRTEFLFLDRRQPPTTEEQEAAYRAIAEALAANGAGRRLVIRTLDIGGDKPVPFVKPAAGDNPFLGVRGIRLGLGRPDLLRAQLTAIVQVAADHPVAVMFPMVTTRAELVAARSHLSDVCRGAGVDPGAIETGIMIEVPAAAVCAPDLAPLVDFFSVGTNDLTQYVMAAERGVTELASYADPLHPAVLRVIAMVTTAARPAGVRVAVCGEAAGDRAAIPILVGLGVTELSVAPGLIAEVKELVRRLDHVTAERIATEALELSDADAVRQMVAGSPLGDASGGDSIL